MDYRQLSPRLAMASLLSHAGAAWADPQGLSTNFPVQIEDAFPVDFGKGRLQLDTRTTNDPNDSRGPNLTVARPALKIGALPRLQLDVGSAYNFGGGSGTNEGFANVAALYEFTENGRYLPALALHAFYNIPYGPEHRSAQYTIRAIATKFLGESDQVPRLHLNLNWVHLTQPEESSRTDRLEIAVGYSQLLTRDSAFVVDAVHGARAGKGKDQSFIDVGVKYEITDTWAASAGVGVGIAQQSPAFRVFVAVGKSFPLF